jgi:ethanolamine ammonia-lyase small subunit
VTKPPATSPGDLWVRLRGLTPARIGLGIAGAGLPTRPSLDFQAAHAAARDAVHTTMNTAALLQEFGEGCVAVRSQARTRDEYLQRPDLGRRLDPQTASLLPTRPCDVAFVIADGLSAAAIHAHAGLLLAEVLPNIPHWTVAPLVLASNGRVALGDEIGQLMQARSVVVLIGERPGLSCADSLGVYVTWNPLVGRNDSERNCISNIRGPLGLGYSQAAAQLLTILAAARLQRLTGVMLRASADPVLQKPVD